MISSDLFFCILIFIVYSVFYLFIYLNVEMCTIFSVVYTVRISNATCLRINISLNLNWALIERLFRRNLVWGKLIFGLKSNSKYS